MAIRYGYFNSVDGDRKYNAEDMTMYFKGLVSDGVFQTIGSMFVVTAGTGLTVNVGTGRALVNMHWVENTAITSLDLGVGSVSADTYKIIVLRCDLTDSVRSVALMVRSMEDESVRLVNTEYITELCLARIRIRKNSSTISQSDIRDYRGSTYCPWITGLIKQVDVATLTGQFYRFYEEQTKELEEYMTTQKESFDNWLASLQGELRVDTKLKNYQSTYTTTGTSTSEIPLVTNYETGDILTVHMNGLSLIEGTEYTLDTENQKIILTNPVKSGNIITQVLTKSTIGDGSSDDSGETSLVLSTSAPGQLSVRKIGKIVQINGHLMSSSDIDTGTIITTIPEEYRPNTSYTYPAFFRNSSSGATEMVNIVMDSKTGEMALSTQRLPKGRMLLIHITYFTK